MRLAYRIPTSAPSPRATIRRPCCGWSGRTPRAKTACCAAMFRLRGSSLKSLVSNRPIIELFIGTRLTASRLPRLMCRTPETASRLRLKLQAILRSRLLQKLQQQRIGINRLAFPPLLFRPQSEDCQVQVRRIRTGIAGSPYIPDHLAMADALALAEPGGVTLQVGIVVAILAAFVEFVDGVAARLAVKELSNRAIHDGVNRRAAWRKNVRRLVGATAGARGVKRIPDLRRRKSRDRQCHSIRSGDAGGRRSYT